MSSVYKLKVPANHLLSASVMSAPAGLALAKLTYPETSISKTTLTSCNDLGKTLVFRVSRNSFRIIGAHIYYLYITGNNVMICFFYLRSQGHWRLEYNRCCVTRCLCLSETGCKHCRESPCLHSTSVVCE